MEKTYYILQKEAYSIYPQVDCLSVFQAQQISSWKIFSGIKPKLSFRLKKKAKFTDVLSSTAGPFTDFLINRYNSLDDNLAKSVLIRLTNQSKNIKDLIG